MRSLLLLTLLAVPGFAQVDGSVLNSQGANATITAGTTAPGGLELDLTRMMGHDHGPMDAYQFRYGVREWCDLRITSNALAAQFSAPVSLGNTLGCQILVGKDQGKALLMFTHQKGSWTWDTNLGMSEDLTSVDRPKTYLGASSISWTSGRWSVGAEVAASRPQGTTDTSVIPMVFAQVQPSKWMAVYVGVSREVRLEPKAWNTTIGSTVRF